MGRKGRKGREKKSNDNSDNFFLIRTIITVWRIYLKNNFKESLKIFCFIYIYSI